MEIQINHLFDPRLRVCLLQKPYSSVSSGLWYSYQLTIWICSIEFSLLWLTRLYSFLNWYLTSSLCGNLTFVKNPPLINQIFVENLLSISLVSLSYWIITSANFFGPPSTFNSLDQLLHSVSQIYALQRSKYSSLDRIQHYQYRP